MARHFYASFGLDVRDEAGGLALYTHGHLHRWARVLGGCPTKRLLWLSFGADAADMPRFAAHLAGLGVPSIAPPDHADPQGLWVSTGDGVAVQVLAAAKCSPSQPGPREFPPPTGASGSGKGRAPGRSQAGRVVPLYLSHVLLFTPDVDQALEFYAGALGLRLSDRSGSDIAFLHTPHGSDHHLVAFAKSDGPGLHHSSWCMPSLDAVGLGMEQMALAGYAQGWGIGRHVLGSNYFRYVRDPWGSFAEYSFDIDFIPAGTEWPAADHPGEDSFYVWGPEAPADFIVNHEAG